MGMALSDNIALARGTTREEVDENYLLQLSPVSLKLQRSVLVASWTNAKDLIALGKPGVTKDL